jgi:hypothetical protein
MDHQSTTNIRHASNLPVSLPFNQHFDSLPPFLLDTNRREGLATSSTDEQRDMIGESWVEVDFENDLLDENGNSIEYDDDVNDTDVDEEWSSDQEELFTKLDFEHIIESEYNESSSIIKRFCSFPEFYRCCPMSLPTEGSAFSFKF